MADWKKTSDGRWIPATAPPRPQNKPQGRARAAGGPPPKPTPARRAPTGLEAEFVKNPITFMRAHPILPPSNSGTGDLGKVVYKKDLDPGQVAGGSTPPLLARFGGGIRYMRFAPGTDTNAPGAKTFTFDPDGSQGGVPIHWLPWESLSLVRYAIPPVPNNLVDPDDEEYPRFFFTAGINGCSVFVQGDTVSPTLTHAGIEGNLTSFAKEFWEGRMNANLFGGLAKPIKQSVSTEDYMRNRTPVLDRQIMHYTDWLKGETGGRYDLSFLAPIGCVFGVRFGRHWTFYLQKNFVATKLTSLKADDVEWAVNEVARHPHMKGQRQQYVDVTTTEKSVNRKLGPLTLPLKKKVAVETYTTREKVTWTMEVGEFFPRRLIDTDLRMKYGELMLDRRPLKL